MQAILKTPQFLKNVRLAALFVDLKFNILFKNNKNNIFYIKTINYC